jgi:hypothetical protein
MSAKQPQWILLIQFCTLLSFKAMAADAVRPVHSEQLPIIAVFDIQEKQNNIISRQREKLTDFFFGKLAEQGFVLTPRDRLKNYLDLQKKASHQSRFSQTSQIELGRELAAQKYLTTEIIRFGRQCQLVSTLYDLQRATTHLAVTDQSSCQEVELVAALKRIAARLYERLSYSVPEAVEQQTVKSKPIPVDEKTFWQTKDYPQAMSCAHKSEVITGLLNL